MERRTSSSSGHLHPMHVCLEVNSADVSGTCFRGSVLMEGSNHMRWQQTCLTELGLLQSWKSCVWGVKADFKSKSSCVAEQTAPSYFHLNSVPNSWVGSNTASKSCWEKKNGGGGVIGYRKVHCRREMLKTSHLTSVLLLKLSSHFSCYTRLGESKSWTNICRHHV